MVHTYAALTLPGHPLASVLQGEKSPNVEYDKIHNAWYRKETWTHTAIESQRRATGITEEAFQAAAVDTYYDSDGFVEGYAVSPESLYFAGYWFDAVNLLWAILYMDPDVALNTCDAINSYVGSSYQRDEWGVGE